MLFNENITVNHCLDDRIKQNYEKGVYKFDNRKLCTKLSHLLDNHKSFMYNI